MIPSLLEALPSEWSLHLACGHVRGFSDPDGRGAPLGASYCETCGKRQTITRRFKDGRETC